MTNPITGQTRLAALFASPSKHSISPLIQNTAFTKQGIDAVYLAFEVNQENLPQAVQSIRDLNMLGVNLSMPNKKAAVNLVDELSETATLVGAINTIVNQEGKLVGHITDGTGFMNSLKVEQIDMIGKKMTILGAGGAALAIIAQGAVDGIKEINIYNRTATNFPKLLEKLEKIVQTTGCIIHLHPLSEQESLRESLRTSQLLVNATSVGMANLVGVSPLEDGSMLHKNLAVADLIYSPRETKLLKEAKAAGCQTMNGLGMLLYQGAAAFELWTGQEMPVAEIEPIISNL